jgi:hypothetical protein
MKTPEGEVVKACLEYLALRGIYAYRQNTGAAEYQDKKGKKRFVRYGKLGASDIVGLLPGGRFIAVECKAPGGRLSDHQIKYLEDIERMGGLAVIARSVEDLEKILRNQKQ